MVNGSEKKTSHSKNILFKDSDGLEGINLDDLRVLEYHCTILGVHMTKKFKNHCNRGSRRI